MVFKDCYLFLQIILKIKNFHHKKSKLMNSDVEYCIFLYAHRHQSIFCPELRNHLHKVLEVFDWPETTGYEFIIHCKGIMVTFITL